MIEQSNIFTIRECSLEDIQKCFEEVKALIAGILPCAEIVHVGSTAIVGCLTKGDMDVLVRVQLSDFATSLDKLDSLLVRSERNASTQDYAEYDYLKAGLPVSIQLVAAGGEHNIFHILKNILSRNDDALRRYNALKIAHDGFDMENYRQAKSEFIRSIIGSHNMKVDEAG